MGQERSLIIKELLGPLKFSKEFLLYKHIFLIKNALIDQRREKFVELIGSIHLQKGIELDIIPTMSPTPRIHVLLLDLLVHLHVLSVIEHEEEND